jgi:hypothetical protein
MKEQAATIKGVRAVLVAVLRHPHLWAAGLGQAVRLARPGWWRRWPALPIPTDDLWRLRMLMAYGGDGSGEPYQGDVVSYLEWCSSARSWRKH